MTKTGFRIAACAILAALSGISTSAMAQNDRSPLFQNLIDCKAIQDPGQRLACFDQRTAELESAEQSDQVIVLDKQQIEEAKRKNFGRYGETVLPESIFGEGMKAITTKVDWIAYGGDGKMRFGVAEGDTSWVQTDTTRVYPRPKVGDEVELKKTALGGFFAKFGKRAMRVKQMK